MMRLFRATAVSILFVVASCERVAEISEPVSAPVATHVPGEPATTHSVAVQVNGSTATVIWHVDPFNLGEGYAVEVYKGASCSGVNLVPGGANVAGKPWTQTFHLYIDAGTLETGEHCARVKSNGVFSPAVFRTFITVMFVVGSANNPPVAGFTGPDIVSEGESATFAARAEDPDGDPLTMAWSVDGTTAATRPDFTHAFEDDGAYTVTLTVDDGNGGSVTVTRVVEVENVPPAMLAAKKAASGEVVAVPAGQPFEISGRFSDPGLFDTHVLALDCNAGGEPITGTPLIAERPEYSGTCSWSAGGTYRIAITITDDDDGADSRVSDPVVVYVPGEGSTTGGGWIDVPAGACRLTPACNGYDGRATFGFVSKYTKSDALPRGNLTFQSGRDSPVFRSTSQLWLSVSGAGAAIGGTGTVSGSGDFEFLLTAVDGRLDGSGVDRLRMQIRDRATGTLVYDSQPGAAHGAPPSPLGGGSVVIHTGK